MAHSEVMVKSKTRDANNNTKMSICIFCKIGPDEDTLGKFFMSKEHKFGVHQHCMFFSAGLPQSGDSDNGFDGFLEEDILKEIQRAKRLRCIFCRKVGASVGCSSASCKKTFHFSCGESKKCLFQYYGEFRAFCYTHRPRQSISSSSSLNLTNSTTCTICLAEVPCCRLPETLTTPCCKDTWFHRACVQKQALVSGYFFRCAVCNNSEQFKNDMKEMGIYVPDRDAAWEGGGNFAELLEKYSRCDSSACQCPHGSDFSDDTGSWEIVLCDSCGQYGIHVGCKQWRSHPPLLLCPTCQPVHESESPCRDKPPPLPSDELISIADLNSPDTCSWSSSRKTIAEPQRKRRRNECDDEIDLSDVLRGLKKRASDDFRGLDLNSETKRIVQRALAAGTAATQNNRVVKRKHSENLECKQETKVLKNFEGAATADDDDSEILECRQETKVLKNFEGAATVDDDDSENLECKQETKVLKNFEGAATADDNDSENLECKQETKVLKNFEGAATVDDDDCVITKYIPACKVCPKCHRRKPINKRRYPATSSVGPSSSMTLPGSNGGPREKCVVDNTTLSRPREKCVVDNTPLLSRPPFMEFLDSKPNLYTQESGEKGFEIIERAARSISKSSVLLIPHSNEENKTPLTASDVNTSCKTATRKCLKPFQTVEDVVACVTSSVQDAPTSSKTSLFATSVERIVQFLKPRFSERRRESSSEETVASRHESINLSRNGSELVKKSISPNVATGFSSAVSQRFPNRDYSSNNIGEFPFLPAVQQASLAKPSVPEKGMSASNGDVDSSTSCYVTLPRSDSDKTVIAAAIDSVYELRSSDSRDVVHRCAKSFC